MTATVVFPLIVCMLTAIVINRYILFAAIIAAIMVYVVRIFSGAMIAFVTFSTNIMILCYRIVVFIYHDLPSAVKVLLRMCADCVVAIIAVYSVKWCPIEQITGTRACCVTVVYTTDIFGSFRCLFSRLKVFIKPNRCAILRTDTLCVGCKTRLIIIRVGSVTWSVLFYGNSMCRYPKKFTVIKVILLYLLVCKFRVFRSVLTRLYPICIFAVLRRHIQNRF